MRDLRTPRLRLEPLEESHAEALFDGLHDEVLYEFISEPRPESVDALRKRYRQLARRVSPDGRDAWLNWAIRSVSTDRYVGWLQATVRPDHPADIAVVLLRDAWGQGYAREAIRVLIDHLRQDWGAMQIRATVHTGNARSIALLEALGFHRGAVRPDAERVHGLLTDEVTYCLPESDPNAL